ncbi:Carbohydrate esterase 4 protein [Mortierella claussenii]|nr:Carbohydrate esterase 4 protein [Mortierella claussenii]
MDLSHFPYEIKGPLRPSLYRPGQVLDSCRQRNSYAISFDDGPGQLTDELLDYLDEQRVKVTFFMNGNNWDCIYRPESQRLLRRAFKAQHQIAAHPWSHRDFEMLSDDEIRQEMIKIEDAFRQILGVVPRYMRPPYGEHSRRVRKIMEEMGYLMILWDVDQLEVSDGRDMLSSSSSSLSSLSEEEEEEEKEGVDCEMSMTMDDNDEYEKELREEEEEERERDPEVEDKFSQGRQDGQMVMSPSSTAATRRPTHTHHRIQDSSSFSSKWAEAVRGVPYMALDRDTMVMGGIYQEATSVWAVEYVQSLGFDVMTIGACLGETDPRLWYKEIGAPADEASLPQSCYF